MKNNRRLTQRELRLIEFYRECQLGMTPKKFRDKWPLTYSQIAEICECSTTTVSLWFARGNNYRRPSPHDLRHLALLDFLLEHYENIPAGLRNLLCSRKRDR